MGAEKWQNHIKECIRNRKWLEDRFWELDYFVMYLGDEMNTHHFDWEWAIGSGTIEDSFRVVLANILGSHLSLSAPAISLFYEQLHTLHPSWVVERAICPPTKRNQMLMKEDHIRPFAIESKMPLLSFDVICLSMDFSLSKVAVPWLLLESGITLSAKERCKEEPFVILGGASMGNPAVMGDFCDLIFFGEGEEVLPELIAHIEQSRREGLSRSEIITKAVRIWDCLYAPVLYEQRFDKNGRLTGTFPLYDDIPEHVRYYRIKDLDHCFTPVQPFLDYCIPVSERSFHEISRGCEGKCTFCFSGMISLPFRTRSPERIHADKEKMIFNTGNPSASLIAFNASSHPQINEILEDTYSLVGSHIIPMSNRIDTFTSNPEYCCFLSMLNKGKIVFGLEGASQRLRDMVSKNIREQDVLTAMRIICRSGYKAIKLMMIANLPGEREEDLEELYALAVKIHKIFEEETPEGGEFPKLFFTWTTLICMPHTPMQWCRGGRALLKGYREFSEKVEELGFWAQVPELYPYIVIEQLFERGDVRLSGLLGFMAGEGLVDHENTYGEEELKTIEDYLRRNDLPPIDDWLRELTLEEPLPWDMVESPASKAYLKKRSMAIRKKHPKPDPICTAQCSGCGACDGQDRKRLDRIYALRLADSKRDLHYPDIIHRRAVRYVMLEFSYDKFHSFVISDYWSCEIRRALNLAGILYDPYSVECVGSRRYGHSAATGSDYVCIALYSHYDTEALAAKIQKYALNFCVKSIKEIDCLMRPVSVTYIMRLPEGSDESAINAEILRRKKEDNWEYVFFDADKNRDITANLKWGIIDTEASDGYLKIKMDPVIGWPAALYCLLLNIPSSQVLRHLPERVGYEWKRVDAVYTALQRESRNAFVRASRLHKDTLPYDFEEMASYITGEECVRDLKELDGMESVMKEPDNRKGLFLRDLLSYIDKTW